MSDYIIATSSTSDLPRTWLEEHNIPFIAYSYTVNDEPREDDCREETRAAVYAGMRRGDKLHTSMINEFVYYDFLKTVYYVNRKENVEKIPKDLPILMVAGDCDPVGEFGKAVKRVYEMYKAAGINDVTLKLYENDRHEILNETDKERVFDDIFNWCESRQ